MECNRDEAVRAKQIAEKKLLEKDIFGAKRSALKAQILFPKLEGISQLLEVVDVYTANEQRINGEPNYYAILGVDSSSNEDVMKKQYRRKALSLHPDKNKSVGADGAFVILSQAWSVLSDQDKRSAYNVKLNAIAPNQTNSFSSPSTPGNATSQPCYSASHHPRSTTSGTHFQHPASQPWTPPVVSSQYTPAPRYPWSSTCGTSTMQTAPSGSQYGPFPQPPLNPTPSTGNQQNSSRKPPQFPRQRKTPAPPSAAQFGPATRPSFQNRFVPSGNQPMSCPSGPETFWTLCDKCRTEYEYMKLYLNQNLLCPRCKEPFLATEIPSSNVDRRSSKPSPIPPHQKGAADASRAPASMPTSVTRPSQPSSGQPHGVHAKRRHETTVNIERDNDHLVKKSSTLPGNVENAPSSCVVSGGLKREKPAKRRRKDGQNGSVSKEEHQKPARSRSGKGAFKNVKGYAGEEQQPRSVKELSQLEMRGVVMGNAKKEILGLLNKWESENPDSSQLKKVETRDSRGALRVDSVIHPRPCKSSDGLSSDPNSKVQSRNSPILEEADLDAPDEFVSMVVPDANFHNFDNDRIEESFTQGQVWAAYDDDDGMPRYYALIHQVISRSPFKIQMSWLNSKTSSEFGPLDWIASGFCKTAGDFRIGKCGVNKRLNSFSHPVKWKKGARGVIQIFPTKGHVWALYSNWSPDWDETTEDEVVHKYDLVMVLENYIEDKGVLVAPLVKVAGFTSVFKQVLEQREIQTIPREEMFRFSHQVPFYMLNGLEGETAPKDCYELDPAALPLELLKVCSDAESAKNVSSVQPVHNVEVTVEPSERSKFEDTKHILQYSRRNKRGKAEGSFLKSVQSANLDAC